eukprot:403330971
MPFRNTDNRKNELNSSANKLFTNPQNANVTLKSTQMDDIENVYHYNKDTKTTFNYEQQQQFFNKSRLSTFNDTQQSSEGIENHGNNKHQNIKRTQQNEHELQNDKSQQQYLSPSFAATQERVSMNLKQQVSQKQQNNSVYDSRLNKSTTIPIQSQNYNQQNQQQLQTLNESSTHNIRQNMNADSQNSTLNKQQNGKQLQDKIQNLKSALSNIQSNISIFKSRHSNQGASLSPKSEFLQTQISEKENNIGSFNERRIRQSFENKAQIDRKLIDNNQSYQRNFQARSTTQIGSSNLNISTEKPESINISAFIPKSYSKVEKQYSKDINDRLDISHQQTRGSYDNIDHQQMRQAAHLRNKNSKSQETLRRYTEQSFIHQDIDQNKSTDIQSVNYQNFQNFREKLSLIKVGDSIEHTNRNGLRSHQITPIPSQPLTRTQYNGTMVINFNDSISPNTQNPSPIHNTIQNDQCSQSSYLFSNNYLMKNNNNMSTIQDQFYQERERREKRFDKITNDLPRQSFQKQTSSLSRLQAQDQSVEQNQFQKQLEQQIQSLETQNLVLENQLRESGLRLEKSLRNEGVQSAEINQLNKKATELQRENSDQQTINNDLIQRLQQKDSDFQQLQQFGKSIEAKMQRKDIYIIGLEKQIAQLNEELDKYRYGNFQKINQNNTSQLQTIDRQKLLDQEKIAQSIKEEMWQMKSLLRDKDKQIKDYQYRVNELSQQRQELTMKMSTPGFGHQGSYDSRGKMKNRNKSADLIEGASMESQTYNQSMIIQQQMRNTQYSQFGELDQSQIQQKTFDKDQQIQVSQILKMLGCSTLQELSQFHKLAVKERKFCKKIQKLVKDVEGKKPEHLKECWRWIRGLLHDFINLKKSIADQQRLITKMEQLVILLSTNTQQVNSNSSQPISHFTEQLNDQLTPSDFNTREKINLLLQQNSPLLQKIQIKSLNHSSEIRQSDKALPKKQNQNQYGIQKTYNNNQNNSNKNTIQIVEELNYAKQKEYGIEENKSFRSLQQIEQLIDNKLKSFYM